MRRRQELGEVQKAGDVHQRIIVLVLDLQLPRGKLTKARQKEEEIADRNQWKQTNPVVETELSITCMKTREEISLTIDQRDCDNRIADPRNKNVFQSCRL
jgi:hypothetical protein